jgi:hypothetical protein
LALEDVNTKTSFSNFGVRCKDNYLALYKHFVAKSKEVKTGLNLGRSF